MVNNVNQEVELIIGELSSFYNEYLPIDSHMAKFFQYLLEALKDFIYQTEYTKETLLLHTTPTLKNMEYAKIDLERARYDKLRAKELKLLPDTDSILERMDELNLYHEFHFNTISDRKPLVYAGEFYLEFTKRTKLQLYHDYFIRDNRLYIMPDLIMNAAHAIGTIHAFNIKYNDYTLEANYGSFFPLEMDLLLPRYRYKNALIAFRRLMASNMYISDILDAVELATERQGMNIYDIKSRDINEALFRLYQEFFLSPLDFIVQLREEHIAGKIDTNIMIMMINAAREQQTYFWLIYSILRVDDFRPEEEFRVFLNTKLEDDFEGGDKGTRNFSIRKEDDLFYNPLFDSENEYDTILLYDEDCDVNEATVMDLLRYRMDIGITMDMPWEFREDFAQIVVKDHPEIPRNFKVSGNNLVFDKNKGLTDKYEVHHSTDGKTFTLFKEIEHNAADAVITIPLGSKKGYYKIRTTERHFTSMFSLIKEVQ